MKASGRTEQPHLWQPAGFGKIHGAKMNSHGRGVKWERGKFPGNPFEVAERRPKIAHGETVGINAQTNKAPDGAKEISFGDFLRLLLTDCGKAAEGRRSP